LYSERRKIVAAHRASAQINVYVDRIDFAKIVGTAGPHCRDELVFRVRAVAGRV
jgi:hypothetical protein